MKEFDKIFLSWRKGMGARRHIVGLLETDLEQKFKFSYIQNEVQNALEDGFSPYTEFPDINQIYNGPVLDVFAHRLIKSERPDIQNFYDFWEIEPEYKDDKFYLLGHTQGLLPTDNFEFLAEYNLVPGLHFLTELAGLTSYQLDGNFLKPGDILNYRLDNTNQFDTQAVKIYKGDIEIGYIKKIHCRVFHKPGGEQLKVAVKAIDRNGKIKKAFIKVYL